MGPATPSEGIVVKAAPVVAPEARAKLLDDLERLAKLRESGALTQDEFDAAKKKLLGT
jgi:hypothetical protein